MEYTLTELRDMLNYMDAQLEAQGRIVDDRLLTRRKNVAQAVANIEESERTLREIKTATANRNQNGGRSWASI
ncbi:hypothetical protein OAU05_00745 [bacterium]|nr:hypothetical protein [bacterium]